MLFRSGIAPDLLAAGDQEGDAPAAAGPDTAPAGFGAVDAALRVVGIDARKLDRVTYGQALQQGLKVVDAAAFSLCMENGLPMVVFAMQGDDTITRALRGEPIGTEVYAD